MAVGALQDAATWLEELENSTYIVLCSKNCFIFRGKYFLGNFFLSPFPYTIVIINVVFG